eukprot:4030712-Prymnesium_polylepis.2
MHLPAGESGVANAITQSTATKLWRHFLGSRTQRRSLQGREQVGVDADCGRLHEVAMITYEAVYGTGMLVLSQSANVRH